MIELLNAVADLVVVIFAFIGWRSVFASSFDADGVTK